VQGVGGSNPLVPTNEIKGLEEEGLREKFKKHFRDSVRDSIFPSMPIITLSGNNRNGRRISGTKNPELPGFDCYSLYTKQNLQSSPILG
jgi:hypothetical protein